MFYIFSYVIFCSSLVHFVVNVFNVFNGCIIYFIHKKKDNIDAVQEELINNPDDVTCRINNLGLPSATFNRIVRIDLKWHPYKIQRRHQLLAADY